MSDDRPPPAPPFAFEVQADGQRVRLEAPTLDGLLNLIEETDPPGWAEEVPDKAG